MRTSDGPDSRAETGRVTDTCPAAEPTVADLLMVLVTLAFFALAALALKGVERL